MAVTMIMIVALSYLVARGSPFFNLTVVLPPTSIRVRSKTTLLGARRASLIYTRAAERANPVDAVQAFALHHGGFDIRAKEQTIAALCAHIDCRGFLAASGVPVTDRLALPPRAGDDLPMLNVGGRWCIDARPAIALHVTVSAATAALAISLVAERRWDEQRWAASQAMLLGAARLLGLQEPVTALARVRPIVAAGGWLLNTNDQPVCIRGSACCRHRIVSYTTNDGYCDVAVPDWTFWHWPPLYGPGGYDTFVGRLRTIGAVPPLTQALGWVGRVQASTWGGGSHPRQRLLRLAALVGRPHHLQVLDSAVHPLSLETQVARYAFLLDVEGNGWSGRLKLLLWSQRAVFLVDRPWKEDFFADLRPWTHFVPVRRDLSDLTERLDWAHANPGRCHAIAQAALAFAMSRLRLQDALRRLASAVREGLLLAPPGFPQVNIG